MTPPNSRYDGKPLLYVLECYVLHQIGELPKLEQEKLKAQTPYLEKAYHRKGEWHEIVAAAVKLPKEMPAFIRDTWSKAQLSARIHGDVITPRQFAANFVDANVQHEPPK